MAWKLFYVITLPDACWIWLTSAYSWCSVDPSCFIANIMVRYLFVTLWRNSDVRKSSKSRLSWQCIRPVMDMLGYPVRWWRYIQKRSFRVLIQTDHILSVCTFNAMQGYYPLYLLIFTILTRLSPIILWHTYVIFTTKAYQSCHAYATWSI